MNISYCIRMALLTGAAGGSALLAGPALAAAPPASTVLEEVIVTAQRTETSLQKTPISVAAISGEALAQRGASNLLDLAAFTPNLEVGATTLQGNGNGRFAIRGIGQDAFVAASVGLYIDEVYYASGAGNMMGLFDVDRIEVLRGPQGTLFGRNTIGGAIQYVTVKPGREFGGFAEATGGNFGRTDFDGAINVPLGDTVSARLSVGYHDRDGYVHDLLNDNYRGSDKREAARLQVRWQPSDSVTVDLKGEMLTQESNGRAGIIQGHPGSAFPNGVNDGAQFPTFARFAPVAGIPTTDHLCPSVPPNLPCINASALGKYTTPGSNDKDYSDLNYAAGAAVIAWGVSDAVSLKSISGYSTTRTHTASDFDASPANLFRSGAGQSDVLDVFSEELQLHLKLFDGRLNWTTGLYYFDQSLENPYDLRSFGGAPLGLVDGNLSNTTSKAIFTQATFNFTDRLAGTVGLRYSDEESDSQSIDVTTPIVATTKFGGSFTDTSPQFGLKFQATDDFMAYGSVAKGFRGGGFGTDPGFAGGLKTFEPEEAWTYEVGLRMEFLDRRLRVNPTVFFTDWSDIQVLQLVNVPEPGAPCLPAACAPGVSAIAQNVGNAEIKGLEFEAQFQATDRLSLQASFGYLDAKYTEVAVNRTQVYPYGVFNPFGAVFIPTLCDGNNDPTLAQLNPAHPLAPPPFGPGGVGGYSQAQLDAVDQFYGCHGSTELKQAPEFKFSVGARYAYPLQNGAQLVTSADYGWTDSQRSQVTSPSAVPMPSYGLLNARVQYNAPDNRWSLAVFGTNLTDEYYFVGGTGFADGYTTGATFWDVGRPAEYGATLRFNF